MVYNATRVGRCGVATNETQQRSTFKQSLAIRTLLLTYTGIARGSLSFRREQLPLDSHHHTVHLPVSDTKQAWNRPPQPHPRTAQMLLLTHPTTLILLLIILNRLPQPQPRAATAQNLLLTHTAVVCRQ